MPTPVRAPVPFGGETTRMPSSLSPKRDCSLEGVEVYIPGMPHEAARLQVVRL